MSQEAAVLGLCQEGLDSAERSHAYLDAIGPGAGDVMALRHARVIGHEGAKRGFIRIGG
ncbi:hypothetical protein D3C71_2241310 [compost metagenome]